MITYKKRLMATSIQKGSLLFVLLLVLIVITGCGDRQVKSSDIELQRQVTELEQELHIYKIENESFPQVINNSLTFIEANPGYNKSMDTQTVKFECYPTQKVKSGRC